jgi:two-component sensor histidine kinase
MQPRTFDLAHALASFRPAHAEPGTAPGVGQRRRPAWRGLLAQLLISLVLCTVVAIVLTFVFMGRDGATVGDFALNWLYSICIGSLIQGFIETSRRILAAWLRARNPNSESLQQNWPGWGWMSLVVPLSVVAGYLLGASLADALTGNQHVADLLGGSLRLLAVVASISLVAALSGSYYFYSIARLRFAETQAEAERRLAAEHQLKLLESQLEPHMLFNTLANLRVLIALDPPKAQQMLDRLIAFLRATLGASQAREHPLATEFERISDYLALMQVRMGARLAVRLDLPDALREAAVPALLLQPVVENAIKHGLEPQLEGGELSVSAAQDGSDLLLTVSDNGRGLDGATATNAPSTRGTGFGSQLVAQRLQTLYGSAASATLEPGPNGRGALVRLRLPLRQLGDVNTDRPM